MIIMSPNVINTGGRKYGIARGAGDVLFQILCGLGVVDGTGHGEEDTSGNGDVLEHT